MFKNEVFYLVHILDLEVVVVAEVEHSRHPASNCWIQTTRLMSSIVLQKAGIESLL